VALPLAAGNAAGTEAKRRGALSNRSGSGSGGWLPPHANPAGGQDLLDLSPLGITAANFAAPRAATGRPTTPPIGLAVSRGGRATR